MISISNPVSPSNPVSFVLPDSASLEKRGLELWIFKQITFFTRCCNQHTYRNMCHGRIKVGEPIVPRRDDSWTGCETEKSILWKVLEAWKSIACLRNGEMSDEVRHLIWSRDQSHEGWCTEGEDGWVLKNKLRSAFKDLCVMMREHFWTDWVCGTYGLSERWPESSWSSGKRSVWRQRFRSEHYIDESWGIFFSGREAKQNENRTEGIAQFRRWTKQQTKEDIEKKCLGKQGEPGAAASGRRERASGRAQWAGQWEIEQISKRAWIFPSLPLFPSLWSKSEDYL